MEMHQIRYFLAVCETLNFTRAAESCNVTQPALTRAVQKLEEEMGGLLLRRERSRTHLTEFGQAMRPHLEEVLRNTGAAGTTAKSFLTLDGGALRLGVMCTVGPLRCVGVMTRFNREHPAIAVSLREGVPQCLADLLAAGDLDLAIMTVPEVLSAQFQVKPLRECFVVAFPPGHHSRVGDGAPRSLRRRTYHAPELRVAPIGTTPQRGHRAQGGPRSERED